MELWSWPRWLDEALLHFTQESRKELKPDAIGEDWNLADCFRVFRRNKTALLCITLAGAIGALIISCMQPRSYQARAAIEVQYPNERFLDLLSVYPNVRAEADLSVQTQVELLRQDSLLAEAARRLHPEATAQPGHALLSKLRQNITIAPLHNTRIVQIICDAPEASMAADLANALAEALIEQNVQTARGDARRVSQTLQRQIEALQTEEGEREPRSLAGDAFQGAMFQEANRARLASTAYQSNVRLLTAAEAPGWPHKPNIPLAAAIGIVGGFIVAAGFVMLREQNSDMLRSPGDVARRLALPELGAVPRVTAADAFFPAEPHSSVVEGLQSALAAILGNEDRAAKIVALTSSFDGEGKTTILSHLGFAIASIGRKTLLIDGNLRNPRIHEMFAFSNSYGLSDLLMDESKVDRNSVDRAIRKTTVPHLYILRAGAQSEHAFRLFHSGAIETLLGILRERFEFILVDAPACLNHPETMMFVRHADGIVLVVSADCAGARTVQSAAELLRRNGSRVIGVVLNRYGSAGPGTRGQ